MRAGLIGQNVGHDIALHHLGQNVRTVSDETDRHRLFLLARLFDHVQRLIQRFGDLVAITARQSFLDSRAIDIDAKKKRAIHRRGQRLRAAHSAKPAGNDKFSFERSAEMFHAGSRKSLESSLHDSLAADVNPRARRHLAVHR